MTKDTLIKFLVLFSVVDPFEELILRAKNLPIKNKQGIVSQKWNEKGEMQVKYKDETYDFDFIDYIILKKKYKDFFEEYNNYYFLDNDNIFVGNDIMDSNNTGRGILIDTFGNYYNGKFKDQKKNGKGLLHIRDVYFLSCKWDNDLKNKVGECDFIGQYKTHYRIILTFKEDKISDKDKSLKEEDDGIEYEKGCNYESDLSEEIDFI